jgi:hypothetical protein
MIWLNFDKWERSCGKVFVQRRIYSNGSWTPFVIVSLRYFGHGKEPKFPGGN